jgi:hypothetical protein
LGEVRELNKIASFFLFFGLVLSNSLVFYCHGWSNGGYSDNPALPKFGTHDWIAQHALDWQSPVQGMPALPLTDFFYGTELPDNGGASEGIGDTSKHHIYFFANGLVQDDASAQRAQQEQNNAVNLFKAGDLTGAAKRLGMMTHYISDVGVFGHVMSSVTDWGAETHHSDYEDYVNDRTNTYASELSSFLTFDGNLENISAYDAAIMLANETTFDAGGGQTCVWMDQNYDWADPVFRNRCGESLNLATNLVADVLHTSFIEMASVQSSSTLHVVINEVELNPPGTDYGTEWVELLNPATSPVNIGGWTISTTAGVTVTVTIPQGTIIQPEGYFVYTHYTQWLDNSNECVVLRDASHSEVDRTPVLSDNANDANSWSRYPNGVDTDSSADWRFQLSTKGASNGKVSSSISCDVTLPQPSAGNTAKVNGQITPIHQAALVEITFTQPSGLPEKRTLATDSSGAYEDQFLLDQSGTWVASASWKGDYDHEQAQSPTALFTVEPGDVYPPVTADNYDGLWHTTDFAITLTATDDYSGVNETFYRINNGHTENISVDGEPIIVTENANNILEYWSVDNVGHEESHHVLTGIKLDKTIPMGSIVINNGAFYSNSTSVTLNLNATDTISGTYGVRFSNDGVWDTELWESFSPTKSWTLTSGDGTKIVYFQVKDYAGLVSSTYSSSILLDTIIPSVGTPLCDLSGDVQPNQSVRVTVDVTDSGSGLKSVRLAYLTNKSSIGIEFSMTLNQTSGLYEFAIPGQEAGTLMKYRITAYDNAGNIATNDNAGQYYVYTVIPEFPSPVLISFLMIVGLLAITVLVHERHQASANGVEESLSQNFVAIIHQYWDFSTKGGR